MEKRLFVLLIFLFQFTALHGIAAEDNERVFNDINDVYQFIAKEEDLPVDVDSLSKLAKDSTLRKHKKIDKYEEVISIEAQFWEESGGGIRGAHNGGSFYIFGRLGKIYEYLGTLVGATLKEGFFKGQLVFHTSDPWSAGEGLETIYKWNGRSFIVTEEKLYRYGPVKKTLLKDYMRPEK